MAVGYDRAMCGASERLTPLRPYGDLRLETRRRGAQLPEGEKRRQNQRRPPHPPTSWNPAVPGMGSACPPEDASRIPGDEMADIAVTHDVTP